MAEVVTGEAVVLDLPVANFPSRMAALFLDLLVQLVLLVIALIVIAAAGGGLNSDYQAAVWLAFYVGVLVAYPTIFETLTRGKTLGKMVLGLRVVGDDGSPERFRQALVRALVGVFEIWTYVLAPVALITSIVSVKGKRVGDIFAGTYVIQERMPARQALAPAFAAVAPQLAAWAHSAQVSRLSDQTADAAGSYLRRYTELSPEARDALGVQLANAVAAQVSPPPPAGTHPAAYLAAVLAVRRDRDHARYGAMQASSRPAPPAAPPPPPATPAPAPPGAADGSADEVPPLSPPGRPVTEPPRGLAPPG